MGTAVAVSAVLLAISLANTSAVTTQASMAMAGKPPSPVKLSPIAFDNPVRCMASASERPPPNRMYTPHGRRSAARHCIKGFHGRTRAGSTNSNAAAAMATPPSVNCAGRQPADHNGAVTHTSTADRKMPALSHPAAVNGRGVCSCSACRLSPRMGYMRTITAITNGANSIATGAPKRDHFMKSIGVPASVRYLAAMALGGLPTMVAAPPTVLA